MVTTSSKRTVIKLYAATGMEAQVRHLATEDLGATWNDVAPPDTSEVSDTGPQSMLTAVSESQWLGIQPSITMTAPARLPDACLRQPNYDWHDGTSQRTEIVIRLTSAGETRCDASTVVGVTGSIGDDIDITATAGGFFPVSPAPATVAPGQSIVVVITVVNPLEICDFR